MAPDSRAEYMKEYRKTVGQFSVPVSRKKLDELSDKLKKQGKTKTQWLNEKIDEELGEEQK